MGMTRAQYSRAMSIIMTDAITGTSEERERRIAILNQELQPSDQTNMFDDPEFGPVPPEAFIT